MNTNKITAASLSALLAVPAVVPQVGPGRPLNLDPAVSVYEREMTAITEGMNGVSEAIEAAKAPVHSVGEALAAQASVSAQFKVMDGLSARAEAAHARMRAHLKRHRGRDLALASVGTLPAAKPALKSLSSAYSYNAGGGRVGSGFAHEMGAGVDSVSPPVKALASAYDPAAGAGASMGSAPAGLAFGARAGGGTGLGGTSPDSDVKQPVNPPKEVLDKHESDVAKLAKERADRAAQERRDDAKEARQMEAQQAQMKMQMMAQLGQMAAQLVVQLAQLAKEEKKQKEKKQ